MAPEPTISASKKQIGENLKVGSDIVIEAEHVSIGDNVSIGVESDEDAFRNPGGVRVTARSIEIGENTKISRGVLIKGGDIHLGSSTVVREQSTINVSHKFKLGNKSYINPYCRIAGRDVEIASNFRMLTWSSIGGGSCFDVHSKIYIGKNSHLGEFSMINTANEVHIGDEVGIGMRSAIFTHGAYQSFLNGYPVTFGPVIIEDNCWLPQAWVLPNVTIGKGTVVATGSLVNKDLPAYCLAAGIPAKVIREDIFLKPPDLEEKRSLLGSFFSRLNDILLDVYGEDESGRECDGWSYSGGRCLWFFDEIDKSKLDALQMKPGDVLIAIRSGNALKELNDTETRCIMLLDELKLIGEQDDFSNRITNQFRRYGVRFS